MIIKTDPFSVFKSQIEADLDSVNERIAHHDLLVAAFYEPWPRVARSLLALAGHNSTLSQVFKNG